MPASSMVRAEASISSSGSIVSCMTPIRNVTRAPRRLRLSPGKAGLRHCLMTLASGCFALAAWPYQLYCPARLALASLATATRGTREVTCHRRLLLRGWCGSAARAAGGSLRLLHLLLERREH